MKVLVALLFLAGSSRAEDWFKIQIEQNYSLPLVGHLAYSFTDDSFSNFETLSLVFGGNQSNWQTNTQPMSMILDLSSAAILLPNSLIHSQQSWGWKCSAQDLCSVDKSSAAACRYNQTSGKCNNASSLMRFSAQDQPKNKDKPPLLNFSLINDTDEWTLGRNGVLGLSPQSPFWNYLTAAYESRQEIDFVQVSISYQISDETKAYDLKHTMLVNSYLTINSNNAINKAIVKPLPENSAHWVLPEVEILRWDQQEPVVEEACVANILSKYLYFDNFNTDMHERIMGQLCPNKTAPCDKSHADFGLVDNIYVTIRQTGNDESTVRAILDPLEFVNFDPQGRPVFMIGDTAEIPATTCPQNTTLAFGRLFFSKVGLVIRARPAQKFEIGLFKLPNESHIFLVMICLLFMQLLLVMLSLLVLKTCKRNEREYIEEQYKQIIELYNRQQTVLRHTVGRFRPSESLLPLPRIHELRFN